MTPPWTCPYCGTGYLTWRECPCIFDRLQKMAAETIEFRKSLHPEHAGAAPCPADPPGEKE